MTEDLVIARAYRGEPLKRVAVRTKHGIVYLVNPSRLRDVKSGGANPVGFPKEDVSQYDERSYFRLITQ